jgi:hypothetical protein
MSRPLAVLALVAALAVCTSSARSVAAAQGKPGPLTRATQVTTEYDPTTDSTTRSLAAYVIVDTSLTPPDTLAVELSQRWKGRALTAPVASVELGLGRTRAEGLRANRTPLWNTRRRPAVVFLLEGAARVRLEQTEYVSNGGERTTFETARYQISPADLRLIAECKELRVRVGDRELWLDPVWRRVVAEMVAGQAPRTATPTRTRP